MVSHKIKIYCRFKSKKNKHTGKTKLIPMTPDDTIRSYEVI